MIAGEAGSVKETSTVSAQTVPDGSFLDVEETEKESGSRLLALDRARGFGIALVVWGHLAGSATPGMPLWFLISISVIYGFHMPLFMYLSGFVFYLTSSQTRFWKAPLAQAGKRFDRLMVPCLVFGAITIIGKYVFQSIGPVDDQVDSLAAGFLKVFTNAPGNPVISIWYLIVLFVYSITAPFLGRNGNLPFLIMIGLSLLAWFTEPTSLFYIERIGEYLIFFAIGGLFAVHKDRVIPILKKWYLLFLALFIAVSYFMLGNEFAILVCGLASLPAIHGLFAQKFWKNDRLFLFLGRNSMAIYLINTIAIGLAKIGYLRVLPYQGDWFLLYLAITFSAGLFVPIIVRYVLGLDRRFQPIKRYID